jgi:hypothetical protein
MKFKSMRPEGYLDCKEYRPGGEFYEWDNDSDGRYLSEICDRCGLSAGDHLGVDTCPNSSPIMTPTPLRGRGRPRKEVEHWCSDCKHSSEDVEGVHCEGCWQGLKEHGACLLNYGTINFTPKAGEEIEKEEEQTYYYGYPLDRDVIALAEQRHKEQGCKSFGIGTGQRTSCSVIRPLSYTVALTRSD